MMQFTQSSLIVGELATGQELRVPVYHLAAKDPSAPKVFVQANVHGAEVQGNAVIFQLMKQLEAMDVRGRSHYCRWQTHWVSIKRVVNLR